MYTIGSSNGPAISGFNYVPDYNKLPQYQVNQPTDQYFTSGPVLSPETSTIGYTLPRYAEYGINLVPSDDLASLRGLGQFNPAPTYEQTTNRGPAYNEALNFYEGSNYYQGDEALKNKIAKNNEPDWSTVQSGFDNSVKKPFQVGSTQFHLEGPGTWSKSTFECNTGSDKFQDWALKSTQMSPNALLMFFFSNDNVLSLQKQISDEIMRIRNIQVAPQSLDELLIIMRNKYLYGQSGWLPMGNPANKNDPLNMKVFPRGTIVNPNDQEYSKAYTTNNSGPTSLHEQVRLLNQAVLEEAVKQVLGGLDAYMQYYSDASSIPLPMSRNVLSTMKGSRALSENLGFESSHEMSTSMSSYNQRFNII